MSVSMAMDLIGPSSPIANYRCPGRGHMIVLPSSPQSSHPSEISQSPEMMVRPLTTPISQALALALVEFVEILTQAVPIRHSLSYTVSASCFEIPGQECVAQELGAQVELKAHILTCLRPG